jgi:hypothetical protein
MTKRQIPEVSHKYTEVRQFHRRETNRVHRVSSYGVDNRGIEVRFPARSRIYSLFHSINTSSEVHPASYPVGTGCYFSGVKAAGAWIRLLISNRCRGEQYSYTSTPTPVFLARVLIKETENFVLFYKRREKIHNKNFWEEPIAYFPSYNTYRIENYVFNNSSIVPCVFVVAVKFIPSRCLATIRDTVTQTDGRDLWITQLR